MDHIIATPIKLGVMRGKRRGCQGFFEGWKRVG